MSERERRLPMVIFVKREVNADGTSDLLAEDHEADLVELSPGYIGEYHLVQTRRRKFVVEDA